jgi:hypothetical protein
VNKMKHFEVGNEIVLNNEIGRLNMDILNKL